MIAELSMRDIPSFCRQTRINIPFLVQFIVCVPSDRRSVTVRELKRPVHELALVCEIEEVFVNCSKILRICLLVSEFETVFGGESLKVKMID